MTEATRPYPHGLPMWVEVVQPDLEAAKAFYGRLFGWTFHDPMTDIVDPYALASVDGHLGAGLTSRAGEVEWRTYVTVDDLDAATALAERTGGAVVAAPESRGAGRFSVVQDPAGARLGLCEQATHNGVARTNSHGGWAFPLLRTDRPAIAIDWYATQFGWVDQHSYSATVVGVPGYGAHRAAKQETTVLDAYNFVSDCFADSVGWIFAGSDGSTWLPIFIVEDREATVELARDLGAELVSIYDFSFAKAAAIRDPQGAEFGVCTLAAPEVIESWLATGSRDLG